MHRDHARHAVSYTDTIELAWDSAMGGVPSLAYDAETSSCQDYGHYDFVMGPEGDPIEQIYYDTNPPLTHRTGCTTATSRAIPEC